MISLDVLNKESTKKHGSQYGESGVIDYIFKYLNIIPKFAVEFGSGTVSKKQGTANIRYFFDTYNTKCIYFETSVTKIKSSDEQYKSQIKLETIKASNINQIFKKYNIPENLDILVIDIDGQDYWIWKNLEYNPSILIIEYNPVISSSGKSIVMHYDEDHYKWRDTNCLYYGASDIALCKLSESKGYNLLYKTNRNLIFVQKSILDIAFKLSEFQVNKTDAHPNRNKFIHEQNWTTV
jgi:prolyl oligopeptidase PreP (S9A serine peptidase family)